MTPLFILLAGAVTGSLLSVLVGMVGRKRRIGFGWAFILSLIFTPIVGLIITLISDPLPQGSERWGCVGSCLALFGVIILVGLILAGLALFVFSGF